MPQAEGVALGLGVLALTAALSGYWYCCRAPPRRRGPRASVLIVGMRGAGKTTLGRGAASALGLPFEDLDATLEAAVGVSCRDFVAANGWPAFRAKELEILTAALAGTGADAVRVLACGGGVVENEAAMERLRAWGGGTVVWIDRPINSIVGAFGEGSGQRPWNGMDDQKLRDMFTKRQPLFERACDKRFVVPGGSSAEEAVGEFAVWLETDL